MLNCFYGKYKIIIISLLLISLSAGSSEEDANNLEEFIIEDFLICKNCGADAALSNFIDSTSSALSISSVNETIFDKPTLVQEFENPAGFRYKVVVLKRANCAPIDSWTSSSTWFPGFAWKLCLCPKCSYHIGWMFEEFETATEKQQFPSARGFYALIVSKIVSEKFTNSLLMPGYPFHH